MEWMCQSPPVTENFPGVVEIKHGPYDFNAQVGK